MEALIPFVVYETATGNVVRSGLCQPQDLAQQQLSGESVAQAAGGNRRRPQRVVIDGNGPRIIDR